jgi:AraC family transcriptional activator of pobA
MLTDIAKPRPETRLVPLSVKLLNAPGGIQADQCNICHRHSSFEIIWITSGSGRLKVDMNEIDVTSGKAYCITPGQMHALRIVSGTAGYVISFTNEFISHQDATLLSIYENGFFYFAHHPSIISISHEKQSFMRETIDRMLNEVDNFTLSREVLYSLLKIFLLDLTRQFEKKEVTKLANSRNADLMSRFLILVEKYYLQRKPVLFYAEQLHVTPNYLNEIVKRVSGFTASHHIHQRIIIEAKRQAAFALGTMKEVALNLGFEDFAHFSRFFKKNAGMNFTEFKHEVNTKFESSW